MRNLHTSKGDGINEMAELTRNIPMLCYYVFMCEVDLFGCLITDYEKRTWWGMDERWQRREMGKIDELKAR